MRIANLLTVTVLALFVSISAIAEAAPIPIVDAAQINGGAWLPVENLYGFDNGGTGDTFDPGIAPDTLRRVHYSERNSDVQLLFDLGRVEEIGQMSVWNYYEGGMGTDGRSTKHLTLSYSSDNADYTSLGIQTLLQQPSSGYNPSSRHDIVPLGASARYVKLSFAGDAGDTNCGDVNWWGLNEV